MNRKRLVSPGTVLVVVSRTAPAPTTPPWEPQFFKILLLSTRSSLAQSSTKNLLLSSVLLLALVELLGFDYG
jgi:hypothetical protein